jgi:hypothetical protein
MPPVLPAERIAHLKRAGDCCAAGFQFTLCRVGVKTGSALVEHKISASLLKPDIYAHNPVQDALVSDEISVE